MNEKKGLGSINSVLGQLFARRGWQKRLHMHSVFDFWNKAVGKEIADHAQPSIIRGKVLWVLVSDQIWMQQLQFQKKYLLDTINSRLKDPKISDIKFKLDASLPEVKEIKSVQKKVKKIESKRLADFDSMISDIKDKEMKHALKAIWLGSVTKGRG